MPNGRYTSGHPLRYSTHDRRLALTARGKVYHTGNAEEVQQMLDAEGAYWYHAHPRTKGTTGAASTSLTR